MSGRFAHVAYSYITEDRRKLHSEKFLCTMPHTVGRTSRCSQASAVGLRGLRSFRRGDVEAHPTQMVDGDLEAAAQQLVVTVTAVRSS